MVEKNVLNMTVSEFAEAKLQLYRNCDTARLRKEHEAQTAAALAPHKAARDAEIAERAAGIKAVCVAKGMSETDADELAATCARR